MVIIDLFILLFFGEIRFLLLNAQLNCDYRSIESHIEYKEYLGEVEENIIDEEYDELFTCRCVAKEGRWANDVGGIAPPPP